MNSKNQCIFLNPDGSLKDIKFLFKNLPDHVDDIKENIVFESNLAKGSKMYFKKISNPRSTPFDPESFKITSSPSPNFVPSMSSEVYDPLNIKRILISFLQLNGVSVEMDEPQFEDQEDDYYYYDDDDCQSTVTTEDVEDSNSILGFSGDLIDISKCTSFDQVLSQVPVVEGTLLLNEYMEKKEFQYTDEIQQSGLGVTLKPLVAKVVDDSLREGESLLFPYLDYLKIVFEKEREQGKNFDPGSFFWRVVSTCRQLWGYSSWLTEFFEKGWSLSNQVIPNLFPKDLGYSKDLLTYSIFSAMQWVTFPTNGYIYSVCDVSPEDRSKSVLFSLLMVRAKMTAESKDFMLDLFSSINFSAKNWSTYLLGLMKFFAKKKKFKEKFYYFASEYLLFVRNCKNLGFATYASKPIPDFLLDWKKKERDRQLIMLLKK